MLGSRDVSLRVLDFDIETINAGFEDPKWTPKKITCVAWSWVGSDKVESRICGPDGVYGPRPGLRAEMLGDLLEQIGQADILTGHNIARYDLPHINAEAMRLGLDPIKRAIVNDTMWLVRSTGFKKGQDNLEVLFQTLEQKLSLNHQEWQEAYEQDGWLTIRRRCESDVVGHKQIRTALLERGYLKPPRKWNG